jgi:hypothetical protein
MSDEAAIVDNPFRVLGLAPTATTREVEREAAKLLGMIELGVGDVGSYPTPLGPRPRTAEAVRAAAAALRDPRRRLAAELWIGGALDGGDGPAGGGIAGDRDGGSGNGGGARAEPAADPIVRWPDALRTSGWGPR